MPIAAARHVWGDPSKLDFIEFRFVGERAVAAGGMQRDAEIDAFELLLKMGRVPSGSEILAGGFALEERLAGVSSATSER